MGLMFALFNVASSQVEPFWPTTAAPVLVSQFYQNLPLFSIPFSTAPKMIICGMYLMASASRGASYVIFGLEC